MRILDETDKYIIGHIFEDAYLIEKESGKQLMHDDFYGDPLCGLISKNNAWAIIAGEHLTVYSNGRATTIKDHGLGFVYALRTTDDRTVEMLIDPWSDASSIWTLDVVTLNLKKVKDLPNHKHKQHTDKIDW